MIIATNPEDIMTAPNLLTADHDEIKAWLESLPMETLFDYARRALHRGIYGVLIPAVSLATTRLGEEFPVGTDLADWIDHLEDTYNSDMEEGFAALNGTL